MKTFTKIADGYKAAGQYLSALVVSPSKAQCQAILFLVGFGVLVAGMSHDLFALGGLGSGPGSYNDSRVTEGINRIMTYIEGSMGALIMVAAGLGAIISAAFGQYRAALALLVVAVGAFILRSLVGTFFNDTGIN